MAVNDWLKLQSMATRRRFLKTTGAATLALASPHATGEAEAQTAPLQTERVNLTINGRPYAVDLDPRTTLLDTLREHLGLTGSKKGCDQGQCGACTVIVNGQRINSCLTLAVMHSGDEITTIEGLANGDDLHRCRPLLCATMDCNAGIAPPDRFVRPSPFWL